MANSKYEYVKNYEKQDALLPSTYIVVRIDGRGFHKLSNKYGFKKPNDHRALNLMNAAATAVMGGLPDIRIAYGISDEFSFVFGHDCDLFERRGSKILSTVVSTFTGQYVHLWPCYFPDTALSTPLPSFDGRVILYPNLPLVKDYLSWRQVDCHINNLYNTTFWALVQNGGTDPTKSEEELKGTSAADKNEIMFSRFGINYNNELEIFKKGTIIYRDYDKPDDSPAVSANSEGCGSTVSRTQKDLQRKKRAKAKIVIEHVDLIKEDFWKARPGLLPS
ncbi:MAG: tRNA-His guanylyltransferase [Icmadophila ericetorum]|nr:tRNA-His guanylyltransferase [Icmadophila ericetorum]